MGKIGPSDSNHSGKRQKQRSSGEKETSTATDERLNGLGSYITGTNANRVTKPTGGNGSDGNGTFYRNDAKTDIGNRNCVYIIDTILLRTRRHNPSRRTLEFNPLSGSVSMGAKQYCGAGRDGRTIRGIGRIGGISGSSSARGGGSVRGYAPGGKHPDPRYRSGRGSKEQLPESVFHISARNRVATLGSDYRNFGRGGRTRSEATFDRGSNIPKRRRKHGHHSVDLVGTVSSEKEGSDGELGITDNDFDSEHTAFRGQDNEK